MIRRDYSSGLFVPVELLLAESDDGTASIITYVLPSSLIAIGGIPSFSPLPRRSTPRSRR
jgi:hypothetical protein